MSQRSLLVIDSNRTDRANTESFLRSEGFEVVSAEDMRSAAELSGTGSFDAVICSESFSKEDIMRYKDVPVIVFTGKSSIEDKISAYENGCDDYLVRPCDMTELLLRLTACLRRYSDNMIIDYSPLVMNLKTREVTLSGKVIKLTNREFEILTFLSERPNSIVSIREIYDEVWGTDTECDSHLVMVNVSYIRKKLSAVLPDVEFISTKWGVGYFFAYPPAVSR